MDKEKVVSYFNNQSDVWDSKSIINYDKINRIFDEAKITENCKVLDIACGTGVLVPMYIERKCGNITCLDIAPGMINKAKEKYGHIKNINFICDDAESVSLTDRYDRAVLFNAFPHFVSPEKLIENVYLCLKEGGIFTVAHDRGRKELDKHHSGIIDEISSGLMSENELEKIFLSKGFRFITKIADDSIYIVSGAK